MNAATEEGEREKLRLLPIGGLHFEGSEANRYHIPRSSCYLASKASLLTVHHAVTKEE